MPVKYVPFPTPGELADAAGTDVWDIGLIGAEPQRAEKIAFTAAYVEIEATYLVPAGLADADDRGRRPARRAHRGDRRGAYDLWLERNIKHAPWSGRTASTAPQQFVDDKLDALAGLRPGLLGDLEKMPGARILDGQFTAVQQAIGTTRATPGRALPARLRRAGEEVGPGGEPDREAQGQRPSVAPLA